MADAQLAVAKFDHKTVLTAPKLRDQLDRLLPEVQKALPAVAADNPARYARCLMTLVQSNNDLATSTAMSLMGGLIQSVQLGLELGGPLGQAYLVPRFNGKVGAMEATFQLGYRGFIALAHRSDKVAALYAQEVFENDSFAIDLGSNPNVRHTPEMGPDRGKRLGVYAVLRLVNGGTDIEWMSEHELEAHKAKFSSGNSPAWKKSEGEMKKKTVIRRLCKRSPVSVDLMRAATTDEYGEEGVSQGLTEQAAEVLGIDLPPPRSEQAAAIADKLGSKLDDDGDPQAGG